MKAGLYLLTILSLLLAGCNQSQPFKKMKDGTEYKVIKNNKGKKVEKGNFIEMDIVAKYGDSLLGSTIEQGMPQYAPYDTAQFPPMYREIFKNINVGDSIVIKIATDSLINQKQAAPFMKTGKYVYQFYKIRNAYTTKEQADSAQKAYIPMARAKAYKKQLEQIKENLTKNAAQLKTDDKIINDYLAANKITATKGEWGTYISITTPGEGKNLDTSAIAVVNYTGKTLKDSVFDSNTDPNFGHVAPFEVDMGAFQVIPGWIDGLKLMKKGSKGKMFIPSSLAYGVNGQGGKIGPNEILVFDVEIIDILTREQYEAKQLAQQQQMMEMQRKMQEAQQKKNDNMQKTKPEKLPNAPK